MRIATGPVLMLVVVALLAPAGTAQPTAKPEKVAEVRMALRDPLVEHVHWARALVVATRAGDRTQARVAEDRTVANARALGDAVASFYGQQAGRKFAELFVGHNRAVQAYAHATFAGQAAAKKAASDRAVKNAADIDAFLSGANPYLPKGAVLNLLGVHWAHHVAQIEAIAKRDWNQEARVWDEMRKHILAIADALAEAIAKQFPGKLQ